MSNKGIVQGTLLNYLVITYNEKKNLNTYTKLENNFIYI